MAIYTYTYTSGFNFTMDKPITTHTIVDVCAALEFNFGDGHQFLPEAVTEGGIQMTQWPGMQAGEFKTARFVLTGTMWPWIKNQQATLAAWAREPARVICKLPPANWWDETGRNTEPINGSFIFKAFHGAPCWRRGEVLRLATALREAGLRPRGVREWLKTCELCEVGSLGQPQICADE